MSNAFGTKIVTVNTANIIFGSKEVATAATAVQLTADSTPLTHGVWLTPKDDAAFYVGLSDVSPTKGLVVERASDGDGGALYIPCNDASLLYVEADGDEKTINFMAV